ncbi:MAG: type II toxin-antitoxin system RelE/ParE family toxin [Bacillota bacterium]
MNYKAEYTQIAKSDLKEILDYIKFELMNPKAAFDFASKVFDCVDMACENPNIYQMVDNDLITDERVRRIVVDNYVVFFRIDNEILTVLRLLYARRNVSEIMNETIKN